MLAIASQLAQNRPTVTTSLAAFTGVLPVTEITRIVVCNTSVGSANFSLFHDDDGTSYGAGTALYWANALAAGATQVIDFQAAGGGLSIKVGGTLGIQTSVASALTFTIYGVTADVTGKLIA